jgi:8-oxo-dGTP pyrophosphatase MutT (NUDIX family)
MSVLWKPSVTVAAIVERDGRFLLVEEETPSGIRLNQPAGHLDPDESLIDAAVREALEETTCAFTPEALLGVYMARSASAYEAVPVTYVRFAFVGTVGEPDPALQLDDGILRTLWLTPDEVRARTREHRSPLVMKCIEDYLTGQRFPLSVVHTHPSAVI